MTAGTAEERSARDQARPGWGDPWAGLLALVLVVALPVLWHAGRHQWFAQDEWDLILRRDLSDPGSMLDGWFGHWVTLPAAAYRATFAVWGGSTYRPYQALGIAGHYAVVVAVWALCRRLGVRGWIALVAIVPLLLFGAGRVNILFGFQVTLTAALALSAAHFFLADHDGGWSRRDWAGLLCGALALLCSGVAVAGAVGVGAAVLLRRGPALAARHTVGLAAMFAAWSALAHQRGLDATTTFDARTVEFLVTLPKEALGGLARSEGVAFALGGLAALGTIAAVRAARRASAGRRWWAGLAPLAWCLVTLAAFALLAASQRLPGQGHRPPSEGRYIYLAAALLLPVIALGIEALARRHQAFAVVPVALLLVGVPGNLRKLDDKLFPFDDLFLAAVAQSEQLATAPPEATIFAASGALTAEELRTIAAFESLPRASAIDPATLLGVDLALGLHQGPRDGTPDCPVRRAVHRRLEAGDTVDFEGAVLVTAVDGAIRSLPIRFAADDGGRLTASGELVVEVAADAPPGGPDAAVYVCPGDRDRAG